MSARDVLLTCPLDCPDACRLKVTLEGGRATAVTGDPDHPITKGFACGKTVHYPLRQYHPDRPLYPMKRVNGLLERVSWDQALEEISSRLRVILESEGPHAILRYNYAGTMGLREGTHVHSFFRALGACELDETICATAGMAAWNLSYGNARFSPELEDVQSAKLILLWGINSLATHSHLTPFMKAARKNGARIIHIDPYQTRTSLFADRHLKIAPGTDVALVYGILDYLFQNNLHDEAYLERAAIGWKELRDEARNWPLERVTQITGLSRAEILDLCEAYGAATPSYIRVGYGMTRHAGGGNALRAVTLLPVVRGQWQYPGGGAALSSGGAFKLNRSRLGAAHLLRGNTPTVNMNKLGEALEPSGGLKALFVYNCNPVVVAPDSSKVISGFQRQDLLTVVLENALTETALMADYVLPATTFLEHEDVYTSYGHHFLSFNERALEPLGECRPNSWIFAELGKRLGLEEKTLYWSMDQLLESLLDTDHPYLTGITPERLKREGSVKLNLPTPFLPYTDGAPTSSGKIHLSPVPEFLEPGNGPSDYPFLLITPPAHHFLNSTYGVLERINASEGGEPSVQIHPDDALTLNLKEGDYARLESEQGFVTRRVKLMAQMARGNVVVEGTWWGRSGPDGKGINTLTSQNLTDLGGGSTFHDTRVRISLEREFVASEKLEKSEKARAAAD